MAGGDVDTGRRAEVPDGKAQLRGGAALAEQPHRNAAAPHNMSGLMGVKFRVDAAVIADADALFGQPGLQNHLCKGGGGLPDDVLVHAVEAHAHDAPQTGGTKFQGAVKTVIDLLGIGEGGQLGPLVSGEHGGILPTEEIRVVCHKKRSFLRKSL